MKNLTLVTSVINICNYPLSYTNTRNVFTHEQRFEQTLNTIYSLQKLSDNKIVFVEGSSIEDKYKEKILDIVDNFIDVSKIEILKNNIDSAFKGKGEASLLLAALNVHDISEYDNLYKISGRYFLNENFNEKKYLGEDTIFKLSGGNLATTFYKINNKQYKIYKDTINYLLNSNESCEQVFYNFFSSNYKNIDILGITGFISVNGNLIEY